MGGSTNFSLPAGVEAVRGERTWDPPHFEHGLKYPDLRPSPEDDVRSSKVRARPDTR